MEYVTLGRTGLKVSVVSLGAGGHSKLGMLTHNNEGQAIEIIEKAVDRGINLIDTAQSYGTEEIVAAGLQHVNRGQMIISTKYSLYQDKVIMKRPEEVERSVQESLTKLGTDYIDIYHLHGVKPSDYAYASQYLVPEFIKLQEKGIIRFLGITEDFGKDTNHQMIEHALLDNCYDVMMIGFNLINQSARDKVFKTTIANNVGVLNMFAVRRALSRPDKLVELIDDLIKKGLIDKHKLDRNKPLDFLVHPDGAKSVVDAAYRYCRHESGVHSVLAGTGELEHLLNNIESANRPRLPEQDIEKLNQIFSAVDCVSGN